MTEQEFFDTSRPSVRRSIVLFACGALIGLAIAGYGLFTAKDTRSRAVPPEAVALVNQRLILRSDFMTQTQAQFTLPFDRTTRTQREQVLQDMVNEELLMQRGLEIDLPSYDPDVRSALVAGVELEVTADVLAQQPTVAELQAYYEQNKDRYSSEGVMQLRDLVAKTDASHPVAQARDATTAAVLALRAGQALDAVIRKFALIDSGRFMSAGQADTGDIFQFAVRAKLDDALYAAALSLRDGDVSDPVEDTDGVHVIAMIKHRFPVPLSFEAASNKVWTDYKNEARRKVLAANLTYLRSRADITVASDYAK